VEKSKKRFAPDTHQLDPKRTPSYAFRYPEGKRREGMSSIQKRPKTPHKKKERKEVNASSIMSGIKGRS
jgi:hypothetical protein